ncbi:uncharacterized protein LOC129770567 [Toxorhynchites rutilus septentrionalis]|uniref:uncharacterized protein LOC129770567 n=1 Tax=Toxorhynchites rutilus septentrionalis TaxID=329112 RepID=UPI0024787C2F|nr:uncharacterized protein LOC129770567 [Toxorhynchites rutilus septentrionalis]
MDLNEHEIAELEERLYSNIHHANTEPQKTSVNNTEIQPAMFPTQDVPVRVVTGKSVVNGTRRTMSKMKRYWSSIQQQGGRLSYPGIKSSNKRSTDTRIGEKEDLSLPVKKSNFTPYQSILAPMNDEYIACDDLNSFDAFSADKQRKKRASHLKEQYSSNPSNARNKKLEQLRKIRTKKAKAQKSHHKVATGQQRLVATIEIESSSEEEGQIHSPNPIKQDLKSNEMAQQDLEDSDPDEVVLIPTAPPPLVCIESSDEGTLKDEFTHPKSKKKKYSKKIVTPRCPSPSNSSIMSDDFIGQSDRTRLNDNYIETIANDDELDCSVNRTVAGDRRAFSRSDRAPSISSDGTVATSSDTTDQEKRNSLNKVLSNLSVSESIEKPQSCSTPKQSVLSKKSAVTPKPQCSATEEDSIYTATKPKTSKSVSNVLPINDTSDCSDRENVTLRSKRSKSYHSDASSTKSANKKRRKHRKRESEHYSDEDFADMLTDIVQAISENEDDSSVEEQPNESANSAFAVILDKPQQPAGCSVELHCDSSNDILDIRDQEPNTISLPQIELQEKVPIKAVAEESNDSEVVQVECPPPPPIIDLADDDISDRQERNPERILESSHQINADPEGCWNDEIRKFYNSSWNCEEFNISTVMFNMPRSSKYWPIIHKDKYPDPPRKEIICNNCGERGHMRYKCRNAPKPRTCYMCGQTGHQEPRCPNTLCLKCGEKTKNFLRGCQMCAREQHMTCHLCGVRGHGQRSCPDKWRRYHSTTEDNKPLTQTFVRNPNAKYCCICSRAGHQAHMCNAAIKIFGQLVPTTEVKSYQPVYYQNERYRQQNVNDGAKYNLFSYMTDYQLNFDEKFTMNENSFYHRFAKSVGLLEKKKRIEQKLAQKKKRESKKRKQVDRATELESSTQIVHDATVLGNELDTSAINTTQGNEGDAVKATNQEDSNYSFSEFYEKCPTGESTLIAEPLPDFIPLVSNDTANDSFAPPANVREQITHAKIYLTKAHAKILLGPTGSTFLKEASTNYDLKLRISFQSVGNVLSANGSPKNQDSFHNELVRFLNDASHSNEQLKQINNVPKSTEKTIRYIVEHLQLLTRSYGNVNVMFKRYQHFEQQGANVKTCDKIRRTLNIILFGQFGMREGRDHLDRLQDNLRALRNNQNVNVSLADRDEINEHIRYIFTSYDHANYTDIINEYAELRKSKKLIKIDPENLELPPDSPSKNIETQDKDRSYASDVSFSVSKDLSFCSDPNSTLDGTDTLDDLILNVSEQLIDSDKSFAEYAEKSEFNRKDMDNCRPKEAYPNHQSTPKSKEHTPKQGKVLHLLKECRRMLDVLNITSITEKFERICDQSCDGSISKANFRTLQGIHLILKGKLQRKMQHKKKQATNS